MFDQTPAHPVEDAAVAATALYRRSECDGIIGFGGGSSIDLAKAVRGLPFIELFDHSHDGVTRSFGDSQRRTGL